MKIKKIVLLLTLILFLFVSTSITVNADMGPKPAIIIDIIGIEGDYVAAFASKKVSGPNFDYESWLKYEEHRVEYHPIMEYKDDEGFKWMTKYYECNGDSEIKFTYYAPSEFKLVIYKDNELYKVTEITEMYAFRSYFKMDFTKEAIKIKTTYPYIRETLRFILRVVLTLLIEVGLFFVFYLYTKRNLKVVLIVNVITQVLLNIIINICTYTSGELTALLILILIEMAIFIIEPVLFAILMKKKNKILIILYALIANFLSFILGFLALNNIII